MATTTSGVAASIIPGKRMAHSRSKIPLTLQEGGCCSFMKQSGTAKLLQQAALIIWDEASMTKRQNVEALDNSLWDIMGGQTYCLVERLLSLVGISDRSSLLCGKDPELK